MGEKKFAYFKHEELNNDVTLRLDGENLSLEKVQWMPFETKEDLIRQAQKV